MFGETPDGDDDTSRHAIREVIDELTQRGLQSDARTTDVLVQAKSARWGQRRLRMELQRRGVARELAEPALAELGGTELARASALWQRRFGAAAATPAERLRQMRWLAARGFAADVVRRVIRDGGNRGAADDEFETESG